MSNDQNDAAVRSMNTERVYQQITEAELVAFVRLVATCARADGTYNYCREALEAKAKELLAKID